MSTHANAISLFFQRMRIALERMREPRIDRAGPVAAGAAARRARAASEPGLVGASAAAARDVRSARIAFRCGCGVKCALDRPISLFCLHTRRRRR